MAMWRRLAVANGPNIFQMLLVLLCHSPGVATVARRLRIDVHNDNDIDNNNDNA